MSICMTCPVCKVKSNYETWMLEPQKTNDWYIESKNNLFAQVPNRSALTRTEYSLLIYTLWYQRTFIFCTVIYNKENTE